MYIKVDHCRPLYLALREQLSNAYSNIVENAEPRSLGTIGMMRTSGERSTPTMIQCLLCCRQCSAYRTYRSFHQTLRPWEPDAAHLLRTQTAIEKLANIFRIVRKFK